MVNHSFQATEMTDTYLSEISKSIFSFHILLLCLKRQVSRIFWLMLHEMTDLILIIFSNFLFPLFILNDANTIVAKR